MRAGGEGALGTARQRPKRCYLTENSVAISKPRNTLLPILTVLFLLSYGLMTMLIIEQGNTINSQRLLIRQLFTDSSELNAIKAKEARKHHGATPADPQAKTQPPKRAPQQSEPRVDGPQAPADMRRAVMTL